MDVLRGARNKKISELGHDQLPQYGYGSSLDRGQLERLLYRLLSEDAVCEFNKLNRSGFANQYIRLGINANDFRSGRRKTGNAAQEKKKRGSEVAAASPSHPTSTNVSSPVQTASRRRITKQNRVSPVPMQHSNGYVKDDFIVSDQDDTFNQSDDESDDFEPIRAASVSKRSRSKASGLPIIADDLAHLKFTK